MSVCVVVRRCRCGEVCVWGGGCGEVGVVGVGRWVVVWGGGCECSEVGVVRWVW